MKSIQNIFLFIILSTLFNACTQDTKSEGQVKTDRHFDLKAFIQEEVNTLTNNKTVLQKEIKFKGQTESKNIEEPDWKAELKVFSDSDINKTAWLDKFEVDTIDNTVYYKCLSPKIKTQSLQLFLDKNKEITRLEIKNKTGNVLYDSNETLTYNRSDKKYSIDRNQKVLFGDMEEIIIRGSF